MLALPVSKEKDEKRKRNTHKWRNPTLLPLSLDMWRWSPVAVMHSDSRYHPLPKTTYRVTSGGRQMNGPMALSVGRVKEANKQKKAAEVQWDVVRKQRRKSTPASGRVFMRRWVKRATNPPEVFGFFTHTVWAESIPAAGLLGFMSLQKRCCRKGGNMFVEVGRLQFWLHNQN